MTIYTLETETGNITAFPTAEAAAAVSQTPFDVFTNQQELAELIAQWPADRPRSCPSAAYRLMPVAFGAGSRPMPPELDKRCRPHLKTTNKSYRVDETYIKVKGQDRYLYRAVDSTGQTIDFLLTAKRDAAGAKRFFRKALQVVGNPVPRVVNVDRNPAYPVAMEALKAARLLPPRVRLRQCKYLNNIVEQDHRTVKKRLRLAKGYKSFQSAWRTLQGIETMHMINKGRVRWLAKGDALGQPTSLPACSVSLPKRTPQHCS